MFLARASVATKAALVAATTTEAGVAAAAAAGVAIETQR
jgi:hypothetical protein